MRVRGCNDAFEIGEIESKTGSSKPSSARQIKSPVKSRRRFLGKKVQLPLLIPLEYSSRAI